MRTYTNMTKEQALDSLLDRIADRFLITNDCWQWIANTNGGGYGQVSFRDRNRMAHRVIYELLVGPVADDMTPDHLCRNRGCVRPDHLEIVPLRVNIKRAREDNPRLTCTNGHPLSGENYIRDGAKHKCRTCKNNRQRSTYHLKGGREKQRLYKLRKIS